MGNLELTPLSQVIYMAFLYRVMSLSLIAYPVVYSGLRGWSVAKTSLGYVGTAVGMAIATIGSTLLNRAHTHFVRKLGPIPERPVPSAERLPVADSTWAVLVCMDSCPTGSCRRWDRRGYTVWDWLADRVLGHRGVPDGLLRSLWGQRPALPIVRRRMSPLCG